MLCEKCVNSSNKVQSLPHGNNANVTNSPSATGGLHQQSAAATDQHKHHAASPVKEIARSPTKATAQQHNQNDSASRSAVAAAGEYDPNECAGCNEQLKEGQALIALERQWHIWCFRLVIFFYF